MVDFSENKKDQILILICETIKFSHSSLFIVFFRIAYSCHNHMVKECSTDEWRPCGYFRNLNLKTDTDSYVIRNLHSFDFHLKGKQVSTRLDLVKGYYRCWSTRATGRRLPRSLLL